jgi:MFS family permease
MTPQEKNILSVTCFGHFLSHFNVLAFPAVVLPISQKLGLSLGEVLGLSFYQYLLFGVSALPWGMVADRFGTKPLMYLFFIGSGLSGLAAAFSMDSPVMLAVSLGGIGLFSGIYHPAALGLISKGVQRIAMAMAYNGMFGMAGLAAAPLITGLVNWIWGPEGAYIAVFAFNIVGILLLLRLKLEKEYEVHSTGNQTPKTLHPFLILLVAMMLGGIAYRGATVILPTYFQIQGAGIYQSLTSIFSGTLSANLVATTLASFIYLLGIIGQFAGGWVGERYEIRKSYLVFHALAIPPAFLLALVMDVPMVLLSSLYFFFLLGMQPVENTLVAALTPPRLRHSAYGLKFILTFGVGALAVHMVGGIESAWGLEWVFPSLGVVSVGIVLSVIFLIFRSKPVPPA